MAFQNVVFPNLKLIHGLKKSVSLPVSVVSNGAKEYRISRMQFDKFRWTYPGRLITETDKRSLYQFFKQVNGSLDSFKFQDPAYPDWTGEQLSFSSSPSGWKFNFPGSLNHPLYVYDPSMIVKRNGNVTAWSHFVSSSDGKPYLGISGSSSGDTITVTSGKIYLAARFDSGISWSVDALDENNRPSIVNLDALSLSEVFEY